jgi:hypothetical protein
MEQTKESEIRYLKSCLNDDLVDDDEKVNIKAFIDALESGLLDEHEGRLAIFLNGEILGGTFESTSSFQSLKPITDNNSYWLFKIPGGLSEFATAYHNHSISISAIPGNGIRVPVQFLENGTQIGEQQHYEVDTGASDTSCPIIMSGECTTEVLKTEGDRSDVQLSWKVWAFGGSRKLACDRHPKLHTLADGSSIRVKELIFKKSQLSAQIGDCEPVEVKSLVLPQRIVEVKTLQKNLLDAKMHPPRNRYPLLLGRDILLKHFNFDYSKEVGQEGTFRLVNRNEITPPPSPPSQAVVQLVEGIPANMQVLWRHSRALQR